MLRAKSIVSSCWGKGTGNSGAGNRGTGEQGNRGTGEQGNRGTGEQGNRGTGEQQQLPSLDAGKMPLS